MPERMKRLWGEQDAGEVEMGGERMTGRGKHGLRAAAVLLGAMILLSGCAGARESDAVSNAMLAIGDRDFEGAVKTLEAAEKDGEHSRSLFRALGIAEMGMGDYQSAAEYLEKALTKSSGIPDDCDFDINFYLASCYFRCGRRAWRDTGSGRRWISRREMRMPRTRISGKPSSSHPRILTG